MKTTIPLKFKNFIYDHYQVGYNGDPRCHYNSPLSFSDACELRRTVKIWMRDYFEYEGKFYKCIPKHNAQKNRGWGDNWWVISIKIEPATAEQLRHDIEEIKFFNKSGLDNGKHTKDIQALENYLAQLVA